MSPAAPAAIGPYSQGTWADDLLFLSGQTPIEPATGALVAGDVSAQAERVFDNLGAVLSAAGLSFDEVIKCNVFLVSMQDFAAMNEVYRRRFSAPYPARTTVAVAELPMGASIEIELVARRRSRSAS